MTYISDSEVLIAVNAPIQTFDPGEGVMFSVTNFGLHGVTWYHNGTEVEDSSRISTNDTHLIIHPAVSSDAGVYQLRITSLHSRCIESSDEWLHLLENLASYAPISFFLQETSQGTMS